jgi:hypothetical protein
MLRASVALLVALFGLSGGVAHSQQRVQPPQPPQPPLDPAVKLQPGETAVPGECLTKEDLDLNGRLRALTRPTRGVEAGQDGDDPPRFNPHYLIGKWTIEGVLPESPLGPAGDVAGVDTVRYLEGCTYESVLQEKGAGGAFTVKSLIVYDRQAGYMVKLEQDSRGFEVLKTGIVGGDAGGYSSHHWDAAAFTYKGKRIRLNGTTFFASPDNYRLKMQIAVDGQPFVNFGTLWVTRQSARPQ